MDAKTEKKIDQVRTQNLAAGGKFRLDEVPIRKYYDQAQYIEKTLLPRIKETRGETSADYTFFCEVFRSLLYGALVTDRFNGVMLRLQQQKQVNQILQARADLAETELMKYTTMENLLLTDGLDKIAADTVRRIENLLTNKSSI